MASEAGWPNVPCMGYSTPLFRVHQAQLPRTFLFSQHHQESRGLWRVRMDGGIDNIGQGSIAKGQKQGFANVARWIALDPDNETSLFRKFDELAARNLLYLQAELLAIEKQLDDLDHADTVSDDLGQHDRARTWETLVNSKEKGDVEAQARMDLILRLREKLKEYQETLLRQREIANLKRPSNRAIDAFSQWFQNPYPALGGRAKTFLDNRDDLVALNSTPEADYMSLLMRRHWPAKAELSRDGLSRVGRFDEKHIVIAAAMVNVLVAAVLLVGSITTLYFVERDAAKLGLVAMFTALFALSIGFMTNARRAEIFAATAAYAAVLVVFVGGEISN